MDVIENIEAAIAAVEEARSVPLSASCVIHRGEMLELLENIKASFPNDLAKAITILRQQSEILENANLQADSIISQARDEVSRLVEQTAIVSAAKKESQRILADATAEGRRDKEEIEAYIDSRLANLEVILNKTLDVISRGREKLAGADPKQALSDLKNR
jgi:cell division septum initiation protein DivIVA